MKSKQQSVLVQGQERILLALARYIYLTSDILAWRFLTLKAKGSMRSRMNQLLEARLVERDTVPYQSDAKIRGGSSPFYYWVSQRGRRWLQEQGHEVGPYLSEHGDASRSHLLHTFESAAVLLAAEKLSEQGRLSIDELLPELELKRQPMYISVKGRRNQVALIPDGWINIDGTCIAIELDRGGLRHIGNESQKRIREKVRHYALAWQSGVYHKRFGVDNLTVAFITSAGPHRADLIRHWTEQELTALDVNEFEYGKLFLSGAIASSLPNPSELYFGGLFQQAFSDAKFSLLDEKTE